MIFLFMGAPSVMSELFAQKKITMSGTVYDSVSGKPVDFGTVTIIEERVKARTEAQGRYRISVSKPGTYTVIVRSQGLGVLNTTMNINRDMARDFSLKPLTINVSGITVTDDKYFQKVSRRKMTREEMKATPASFGDAINALTSLPGIERTDGFFGPLVIRGMYDQHNRYYIDGMPISNPMHFGGLHAVINTNLMDEINLYSSSFPARFGGAMAAVIDISTVDNVKEEGGYVDTGLISTNILYQRPFTREVTQPDGEIKKETTGYIIASGRYGYLGFIIPYLYEKFTDKKSLVVPEYYDYQVKIKQYLDSHNSLTLLFIGSKDYFRFFTEDDTLDEEADPLLNDIEFEQNEMFHNLGLYYDYRGGRIKNRVMAYASLTQFDVYVNSNQISSSTPDWLEDLKSTSKPYIFGLKNIFDFEWIKNHADLKASVEYTYYRFEASGESVVQSRNNGGYTQMDDITTVPIDGSSKNHTVGGFIENRFTAGGLTFVPGLRSDYLKLTDTATFDPRGMISYEFSSDTTVSVASGKYSSFFQVNPYFFNYYPDVAQMDTKTTERAYHNVIGIEQVLGLYTLGIEGYYNHFENLAVGYPHYEDGEQVLGQASGKMKAYGFEVMLRKDMRENTSGFFGWMSYTYCVSKYKSGITGNIFDENGNDTGTAYDPNGDKWINSDFDRRHSVKLVLGYKYGKFTFSGKFQYLTAYPSTAIIGSTEDTNYPGRYTPVYDISNQNEYREASYHRLDLRISHKTSYEWGYVSWYVEVINVYNSAQKETNWKYNQPYSDSNPDTSDDEGLTIIPNFGVEIKF